MLKIFQLLLFVLLFFTSCHNSNFGNTSNLTDTAVKGTYAYDAKFLKQHTNKTLELSNGTAKVLLSADYEGRVMTSTATGDSGTSFGWLNYDLISASQKKKQFNPMGGEERFWIGPEGGQYSLYFKGGDSFNITHWQVPAVIDTESYTVQQSDSNHAVFTKAASLTNYSGTTFNIDIERTIRLLDKNALAAALQIPIPGNLNFVGFETDNKIINTGQNDWTKVKVSFLSGCSECSPLHRKQQLSFLLILCKMHVPISLIIILVKFLLTG